MSIWTNEKIVEWHKRTFPNATLETQLRKVEDELQEMKDAGMLFLDGKVEHEFALEEVADVYIAAIALVGRWDSRVGAVICNFVIDMIGGLAQVDEIYVKVFQKTINAKMDKNAKRTWHETAPGYYQHVETVQ